MGLLRLDSIRRRLTAVVLATTGLALTATAVAIGIHEIVSSRSDLMRQTAVLADVIAKNSAAPLLFDDPQTAGDTIASVAAEPAVQLVCLYADDGSVFARYAAAGREEACPRPEAPGARFAPRRLLMFRPVVHQGARLGSLYLATGLDSLETRLARSALILAAVLGLALALASLVVAPLQRRITRPIADLVAGSRSLADGDLSVRIRVDGHDELGTLSRAFSDMAGRLRALIGSVRGGTGALAGAVQTLRGASDRTQEDARRQETTLTEATRSLETITTAIGSVGQGVQSLAGEAREATGAAQTLDESAGQVASRMEQLGRAIEESSAGVSQLAASAAQIAANLESMQGTAGSTATAATELRRSSESIREHVERSQSLAEQTSAEARRGLESVSATIAGMENVRKSFEAISKATAGLSEKSDAIGEVVDVINPVASETAVLSLNAHIIAAQSGQHGKAFAVVAQQVSTLAERTTQSARQITQLVAAVQEEIADTVALVERGSATVGEGVRRSNEAGVVLQAIHESADESARTAGEIARASESQVSEVRVVEESIAQVRSFVSQVGSATREQEASCTEIASRMEVMHELSSATSLSTQEQRRESGRIREAIARIAAKAEEIAAAMRRQAAERETLDQALVLFRRSASENAHGARELESVVETLSQRSDALEREIGRFRL